MSGLFNNCWLVATALWAVSSEPASPTQIQNGPQGRGYSL
jgi:hypothetical protein